MCKVPSLFVSALVLGPILFCPAASGQEEGAGRLVGLQLKGAAAKGKPGKLSRELEVVKRSGGRLVANAPDGTLIVSGVQANALADLLASSMVRAITDEVPKERSPVDKLRLSYAPGRKPAAEELEKMGLALVEDYAKGSFLVVRPKVPIAAPLLAALEEAPAVTYVAPVMRIQAIRPPKKAPPPEARGGAQQTPNDPRLPELWGIASANAARAWGCVKEGPTVVAVIDTGVDYTHEDLQDTMWKNPLDPPDGVDNDGNGLVDDVHGADFVNGDGDPMDDNSHGTHCAGTVAGVGNNGKGVVGMNWKTPVMALKWLDAGGFGSSVEAIKCIDYAVGHGAKVLSNSWWHPDDPELREAIVRARDAGVLFVAAAGNFAKDNDDPNNYYRYPSSYDVENIISVAATEQPDTFAGWFSSFGATTVDLAAPGVDVLSSVPGNGYELFTGTSMATPHVAGAAALVWNSPANSSATWGEVRDMILANARPLPSLSGKCATGGTLDVSFLESAGCGGGNGGKCCPLVATGAFGWHEFKTVGSNSNISELSFTLDEESDVLIRCSTSALSVGRVTFTTGTYNAPDANVMWTYSLRTITATGSNASVPVVTDMSVRLPKGKHTIYWKVWVFGDELRLDSGTMQVLAVPAHGAPPGAALQAAPVTRFGEKHRRAQISAQK